MGLGRIHAVTLAVVCTLGWSGGAHAAKQDGTLSALAKRGRSVMRKAQCHRCHDVTDILAARGVGRGLPEPVRTQSCTGCHEWILSSRGNSRAIAKHSMTFPDWARYLETIEHFTKLPDLGTLTRRIKPEFVRSYLDAPHDLRPHLDETMVPVRLNRRQKDALVAYISELGGIEHTVATSTAPAAHRVAQGRARFAARGCTSCHVFGNVRFSQDTDAGFYSAMKSRASLAPNLRYVRERMTREALTRFIRDPQAVDPHSPMPNPKISEEDVGLIADFLLHGDPQLKHTVAIAKPRVDPLPRRVKYEEVHRRVFGTICVHCHMDPANNDGRGGPGNTGGLGFSGVGLSLENFQGVTRGVVKDGRRVSITRRGPNGEPSVLWAALMRRFTDAGRMVRTPFTDAAHLPAAADTPGMPMGLPPLSHEDLRLIRTWLDQGAPGPRRAER